MSQSDSLGKALYERWCRAAGSDVWGYFRMMNAAEQRRWQRLAQEIADECPAYGALLLSRESETND